MRFRAGVVVAAVAILCLVLAGALSVLPNSGHPLIADHPPGRVDCGTFVRETRWSGDDGCEGPVLARLGVVVALAIAAVVIGGAGALLLRRGEGRVGRGRD